MGDRHEQSDPAAYRFGLLLGHVAVFELVAPLLGVLLGLAALAALDHASLQSPRPA